MMEEQKGTTEEIWRLLKMDLHLTTANGQQKQPTEVHGDTRFSKQPLYLKQTTII